MNGTLRTSENICTPEQWNWAEWLNRHCEVKKTRGKKRGNIAHRMYISAPCAFDIETSRVCEDSDGNPQTIMYIWQFQIGLDCTVMGRTWEEYLNFCQALYDAVEAIDKRTGLDWRLVVWVHNLAHEFQYLSGVWNFSDDDVFAVQPRKVIKADQYKIEYRCSMRHSNQSLDSWSHQLNAPHAKATGTLDYSKVRYPWTPVTDRELTYCVNDVRCIVECILVEMQRDGDDLYTIPLTRTGYVRRDVKRAMYSWGIKRVQRLIPDYECYTHLREAFRGGDTHANRYYVGIKLENVHSVDMSSAYPGVQLECKFPMTPLVERDASVQNLYIHMKKGFACLAVVQFEGLEQKYKWWGMPYMPLAKTRHAHNYVNDNGRLLSCAQCEVTITDIDMRILAKEYKWKACRVLKLYTAQYGYLPREFRDVVEGYFVKKTTLKGVEGQELYYMKSKNDLNSCFGMSAQDPLQVDTVYDKGEWSQECDNPEAVYDDQKKHLFLPYQWGVWTTAWTRCRLKIAQWAAGKNCVYCDTDSVKYVGDIDLTAYNAAVKKRAKEHGASAVDPKGVTHYMGVYEQERDYAEFMTWGAKKYVVTYRKGGPLTTTIAGVSKKRGGMELALWGGFDAFRPGFTFCAAAGNLVVYNDFPTLHEIEVDGHKIPITRNLCICENTYTVGITGEYARLLGLRAYEPIEEGDIR